MTCLDNSILKIMPHELLSENPFDDSVCVAVRCRPLSHKEKEKNVHSCISVHKKEILYRR